MESLTFILIASAVLNFGLFSGRLQRTPLSAPMFFVALGIAMSYLGLGDFDLGRGAARILAELTLVLVLFTDAARIDLRVLRRSHDLPVRDVALRPRTSGFRSAASRLGRLSSNTSKRRFRKSSRSAGSSVDARNAS